MTALRNIAVLGETGGDVDDAVRELAHRANATVSFVGLPTRTEPLSRRGASAVVVGSSLAGSSGLAEDLVRATERPVLVVPRSGWELSAAPNLLVAIQHPEEQDAIAQAAARIARALRARLTLVHVVDAFSGDLEAKLDRGWLMLASAVRLVEPQVPVAATVAVGDPASELLSAASESCADLLAIGIRSVTAQVIEESTAPVLLLPTGAPA
jgi:nucleotide-binding universal stress UspA family protein